MSGELQFAAHLRKMIVREVMTTEGISGRVRYKNVPGFFRSLWEGVRGGREA
jgi:hypothetical protein